MQMNKLISYKPLLVLFIVSLGAMLRLYNLSTNPPALYWDEVAIGYNALSLVQTGKDEYGKPYPLWFRSFDDYKLPGYIYLDTLPIALTGFTNLAVRLPSALAGTVSILLVYFLSKFLIQTKMLGRSIILEKTFPLSAALLFAISPWSLQFSRAAFEANLALAFTLAATLFFIRGISSSHRHLLLFSSLCFVLSIYTYHSSRLFTPLFIFVLAMIYAKKLKNHLKSILISCLLGFFLLLPSLPSQLSLQGTLRPLSTSYLTKLSFFESLSQFISSYLDNFEPGYLFFHGDSIGRHSVHAFGMLNFFEFPLVIFGLFNLSRLPKNSQRFILAWLLLAPIPASLTTPSPHALRSLIILPAWIWLSAFGLALVVEKIHLSIHHQLIKKICYFFVLSTICYNLLIYLYEYHIIYPRTNAPDWSVSSSSVIKLIYEKYHTVDQIYLTDQIPPIYIAAFFPINPAEFQTIPHSKKKGQPLSIFNITYFSQAWTLNPDLSKSILFISPWWQPPPSVATESGTINSINGDPVFNYWFQYASTN